MKKFLAALFLLAPLFSAAQNGVVRGSFAEAGQPLIGVTVRLSPLADSADQRATVTDLEGKFAFTGLAPQDYRLTASYIGYRNWSRTVALRDTLLDLGALTLDTDSELLREVVVTEQITPSVQRGDTTEFNARAFKTNPDAEAEDLLKKMPGITVENGVVKAQGEEVRQVLVDGKPFFGDDPGIALRNLPAEVVEKIQVFNQLSDQAQLTGFDDGNTSKTINIVTRADRRNGQFGKVYGGYGDQNRYQAGGNLNFFSGDRRVSVVGMANNINQQNFSSQDLLGVTGASGGRGSGGGRGQRGGGRGSGGAGNFLVGNQTGITETQALGLNLSDQWGKKAELTASYFFNRSDNERVQLLNREYFLSGDSSQFYRESSNGDRLNFNHRLNARLKWEPDSTNTLIFTPRLSWQNNRSVSDNSAENYFTDALPVSQSISRYAADNAGYNLSGDLVWRHKFAKRGRTLSLGLNTNATRRSPETLLHAENIFFGQPTPQTELIDQRSTTLTTGFTLSPNVVFTEPVGPKSQLSLNYNASFTRNESEKLTYDFDASEGDYARLDTALSNQFDNAYDRHRAGLDYRFRSEKLNVQTGLAYQYAGLNSAQLFPEGPGVVRDFHNLLPSASLNLRFSKQSNLRVQYRANTNAPSIDQLQNVLDNSNPLLLSAGNPDLKQAVSHVLSANYARSNTTKSTNLFAGVFATFTDNYIANSTFLATRDTVAGGEFFVPLGAQFTRPVNLGGYRSLRAILSYGLPVKALKINVNLNPGVNYTQAPGLLNGVRNRSENLGFSQGITLSSNISENLDFTIGYNAQYNLVRNATQPALDDNYFTHTGNLRLLWQFWQGFVVQTDLTQQLYRGLDAGLDREFLLWNFNLAKKFGKKDAAELKFGVYDLLNQNDNVGRTVNETYLEDSRSNVLNRYFLLTFTYRLKNFGS